MTSAAQESNLIRERLTVRGVVQGVGFRPFVYGQAVRLGLSGFVGNDSSGVFIEVEGAADLLEAFRQELRNNPPPLAHIEAIEVESLPASGAVEFTIVPSAAQANASTLISPDLSICADCLRELFDPTNRRYLYPFINCTNCGPRFTIIKDIPYDRPATTMANFPMCPACKAEYDNPLDRRFHAQPNACPECGPQVFFQWVNHEQEIKEGAALEATRQALADGKIVAIKGLGGFHLACDARNEAAVQTLRQRKGRADKPFALMIKDLQEVGDFAWVDEQEAALLMSRERPIVLLKKKTNNFLAAGIAPGNDYVGVMLPYTPLHYLLVGDNPLVMTSGNFSAEPIVKDNAEAFSRLEPLADAFLWHNRDIYIQCDDSVIRIFEGRELPVRRSRGYAPFPVRLPFSVPPVLAVGGELKSTFCLTRDNYAFMSQHIGDMENLETLETFGRAYEHLKTLFRIEPELIVSDKHPRYLSATWAANLARQQGLPLVQVQHHHAHIAAVMAENGLDGTTPVLGFAFDGTGYGPDGAIWGGEVLIADYENFRRAGHLSYISLPGGDAAVKRPYRVALAHLRAAGIAWDDSLPPVTACSKVERQVLSRQLETGLNCVPTSSMGRFFDAIASLAGIRQTVSYEAQAAIEFEALITQGVQDGYHFEILEEETGLIFEPERLLKELIADIRQETPVKVISAKFHQAVAELIVQTALRLRERENLNKVALSGGVFQNVYLLGLTLARLKANGFEVVTHRQVPPNDGGLALGQAIIAARQSRKI
jgi:hydrogenase maturation protein HypF